jgi:hypothetical protein
VVRSESVRRSCGGIGSGSRSDREERRFELAGRITDRDRAIFRLLYEHRVLTTAQVADIGFPTIRKAQKRLAIPFDLEAVDHFRPRSWSGSNPFHFVLGTAGAAVIAAERDVEISDLHWHRNPGSALGASSHLPHLVGSNGFFTALVRVARAW